MGGSSLQGRPVSIGAFLGFSLVAADVAGASFDVHTVAVLLLVVGTIETIWGDRRRRMAGLAAFVAGLAIVVGLAAVAAYGSEGLRIDVSIVETVHVGLLA